MNVTTEEHFNVHMNYCNITQSYMLKKAKLECAYTCQTFTSFWVF